MTAGEQAGRCNGGWRNELGASPLILSFFPWEKGRLNSLRFPLPLHPQDGKLAMASLLGEGQGEGMRASFMALDVATAISRL